MINKLLPCLAAILCAALLPSCVPMTPRDPNAPPPDYSKYIPYIAPVATGATAVVLGKATDDEDRADKAAEILVIADALLTLTSPDTTGADITAVVIKHAGSKPHWIIFASTLGMIYDSNVKRIGQSRAVEIINAIATGLRAGAAPFAPSHFA